MLVNFISKINQYKEPFLRFSKWFTNFDDKSIDPFEVDFSKSWWSPYLSIKTGVLSVFATNFIISIYDAITPIWLGYIFSTQKFEQLWAIAGVYVLVYLVLLQALNRYYQIGQGKLNHSLDMATQNLLLEVDPSYHTTKSSGEVLSKISRIEKYVDLLENLSWGFFSLFFGAFFSAFSLFAVSFAAGLAAIVSNTVLIFLSLFLISFSSTWHEQELIKKMDSKSESQVENMTQALYIRATFATSQQLSKFKTRSIVSHLMDMQKWRMFDWIILILRFVMGLGWGAVIYFCVIQIQSGNRDSAFVAPIIIAYMINSSYIIWQGNSLTNLLETVAKIKDYWKFMKSIPQGSYPVLDK